MCPYECREGSSRLHVRIASPALEFRQEIHGSGCGFDIGIWVGLQPASGTDTAPIPKNSRAAKQIKGDFHCIKAPLAALRAYSIEFHALEMGM